MKTGDRIGGYELLEKVGEGGMAEVWKARNVALDRVVAIKFLLERFSHDPDLQQRFLQEGRIQARLQHPQIVSVLHADAENGRAYLVTDYIEGKSLEELLHQRGRKPLGIEEVLSISYDVLGALEHAHSLPQGAIVHRDVKPSNILLDRQGRARLADFGIAVALNEDRKTKTGYALGSVFYMSPEQIQTPRAIDWRSDIYSFGCVLYEMLTGRPPFGEETDSDFTIKQAHVQAPPEPMRKWNPQVPFEFEWIVFRALSKDRERRFTSAAEMADALRPIVPGKQREKPQRTPTVVENQTPELQPIQRPTPPGPIVREVEKVQRVQDKRSLAPEPHETRVEERAPTRSFWKRVLWPDFPDQQSANHAIRIAAFTCALVGMAILGAQLNSHSWNVNSDAIVAIIVFGALSLGMWRRWRIAIIVALAGSFLGALGGAGDAIDYMNWGDTSSAFESVVSLLFRCLVLMSIPIYIRTLRDRQPSWEKADQSKGGFNLSSKFAMLVVGGLLVVVTVIAFPHGLLIAPILVILYCVVALGTWPHWKRAMLIALILSPLFAFFFGVVLEGRWLQGSWAATFLLAVSFVLVRALRASLVYARLT